MNCGSMNARALAGKGVFCMPDPWCSNEPAFPNEVEVFKNVMAKLVQESTRNTALSVSELLPFLTFLVRHGLSVHTVRAILSQLGGERISQADVKWRRVALADRLQFDIFRHYYRRMRPDFATFFINSTAHLQHAYWRHMQPDAFSVKPSKMELKSYGGAVLFGYRSMDALLRQFCSLIDPDTTIILCSALSQQPFLKRETRGGQHFYRLRDISYFLELLGITPRLVEPVMTHQYLLRFADRAEAEKAMAATKQIRFDEQEVFGVRASGSDIHLGCQVFDKLEKNAKIYGIPGRNEPLPFLDLFYPIDAIKSGRHHPEGVLWLRTGHHAVHADPVSILDIAPTIYDLMGVSQLVDGDGLRGASLAPHLHTGADVLQRRFA
jgi:hypothetical protein